MERLGGRATGDAQGVVSAVAVARPRHRPGRPGDVSAQLSRRGNVQTSGLVATSRTRGKLAGPEQSGGVDGRLLEFVQRLLVAVTVLANEALTRLARRIWTGRWITVFRALKRTCCGCCGISCAANHQNAPCPFWKIAALLRPACIATPCV